MIGIFLSNVLQSSEKLGLSHREMLKKIKEIGYDYVDADWNYIRKMPQDFFDMLNDIGLNISLYVFLNTSCFVENDHHISADIKRISELGITRMMLVWLPSNDETKEESEERILHSVNNLFEEADRAGIRILAEDFDSLDMPCASTKDLIRYAKNLPRLGFTFDTGNFLIHGEDITESFELMKNNIKHVHIKDRASATCHSEAVNPGKGNLPIKEILHKLYDNKYDGWITAELPNGNVDICVYEQTYDFIRNSFQEN